MNKEYWQAIINRDRNYDRRIVYGVVTTKICCVPSCPARKPKKTYVIFFKTYSEAEKAGFRACKRCLPQRQLPIQPKIEIVELCREIESRVEIGITLAYLARKFELSSTYIQRLFEGVTGISPKQYLAALRLAKFKKHFKDTENIALAIYAAGYSSNSSLYENISLKLGMTPKIYQQGGIGTKIIYATVKCDLGYLLIATTDKGICAVKLGDRPADLVETLKTEFDRAALVEDNSHREWSEQILRSIEGTDLDLPLDIRGTVFQQQVWQALQKIPYGETRTYQEIANELNKPKATRAVGSACGANPIALVIPCHRVLRSDGGLGGYRWGIERKQKLLEIERR